MKELKENKRMYKVNISLNILMLIIYIITVIVIVNILKETFTQATTELLTEVENKQLQMYNLYTEPSLFEYILKGMFFASIMLIAVPVFQSYILIKSVIYSKVGLYKKSKSIIKIVVTLNTIALLLGIIIQGLSYNGSQAQVLPLWIVEIVGIILLIKVKKNINS